MSMEHVSHNPRRNFPVTTDRYQRGLDRMMELVSTEHSNTFDHAKLVESYKVLDAELADYIVRSRPL
jgi:hypothetical protein